MNDNEKQPIANSRPVQHVPASAPSYDTQPHGLEQWFDTVFNKKAPFQFPDGVKDWLANNSWWLVLVGAVLSLLGALGSYQALSVTNEFMTMYNLPAAAGMTVNTNAVYLSVLTSIVSAVLLFMASSKLKVHQKAGWNLLFYNFLLSLGLSIVSMLMYASYNFVGSLLGFIVGMAIGAFILFQIRSRFNR